MNLLNTHIIILPKDFFGVHTYRPIELHMRSLEKYLEKNNRTFLFEGDICTVHVHNKQDALRIGMENHLREVLYIENSVQVKLQIAVDAPSTKRTKIIVSDNQGNKTSLRKIKQQPHLEAKNNALNKSDIVKRRILTKKELDDAIRSSKLTVTVIGKTSYVNRKELSDFLFKKNY